MSKPDAPICCLWTEESSAMRDGQKDLINITARRRDEPGVYGTVIDETDTKVRIRWANLATTWEQKRDVVVLD